MTKIELASILSTVEVGSLIDIVEWDIERVEAFDFYGWLITCRFRRPDRDTGKIEIGAGRPWFVGTASTPEQVARTAFSAVKMLVEHELLEFFRIGGERLFDPHERGTAHGESLPPVPAS